MKNLMILASAVMVGGGAFAQAVPVAPPTPMAHPMADKVMTRAEVVQMVREHFGKMDADRNGAISKTEIESLHTRAFREFRHPEGGDVLIRRDPNAAFDRLDANKDGSISREEFAAAREERIERRIVRREEMKQGGATPKDGKDVRRFVMRHHGPGMGGRMIVMADTDKDGQITLAEAETMALQHFDQMDANRDGQVTREERRAGRPFIIRQMHERKKGGS